jgi:hypothetical protein
MREAMAPWEREEVRTAGALELLFEEGEAVEDIRVGVEVLDLPGSVEALRQSVHPLLDLCARIDDDKKQKRALLSRSASIGGGRGHL